VNPLRPLRRPLRTLRLNLLNRKVSKEIQLKREQQISVTWKKSRDN
jgi:hypothetical protein